jgi:hypothetical protein
MNSSIPFSEGLPLAIDVPIESIRKADNYIDDLIVVISTSTTTVVAARSLNSSAVHPHAQESVLRNHVASFSKLLAERRLEEVKTILGWTLDTRLLLLSLQVDKHKLWSAGIRKMITDKSSRVDKLNTVGRLNHVGSIIPVAQHFLGTIWHFEEHYYPTTTAIRQIPRDVLEDLRLWLDFLEQAQRGINRNILTIRERKALYRADVCKHGMGGFHVFHGRAWHLEISPHL